MVAKALTQRPTVKVFLFCDGFISSLNNICGLPHRLSLHSYLAWSGLKAECTGKPTEIENPSA